MARPRKTVLEVKLNGREIGWLLEMGDYALEEQIEIRDHLAAAQKIAFLAPVLTQIEVGFVKLAMLEDHRDYLQQDSDCYDMARLEQEIALYRGVAYKHIDRNLAILNERLQSPDETVDARCLQDFLRLTYG